MKSKTPFKSCFLIITLLLFSFTLTAQDQDFKLATVAFYNLENLFDTVDNEGVEDTEYTPRGEKNWNYSKYQEKLENLSLVISRIGNELSPLPPTILGVSEVENRKVLEDLVSTSKLKDYNYGIVHENSPDERGIDVALLYQESLFEVTNYRAVPLNIKDEKDYYTRDQLVVSGILDNEKVHFIVNHWPSRYGGEKRSRPYRIAAAKLCRSIVDSIIKTEDDPKIIVMGDFNDDPTNKSVKKYLNSSGKKTNLSEDELYNPMMEMYQNGLGTLAYRDQWNLFDQILLSEELTGEKLNTYKLYKAKIFNRDFVIRQSGRYKGYPKRTHAAGIYLAGYSDHLPVYVFLIKATNQ
jgi:predicted extracellular nuclease